MDDDSLRILLNILTINHNASVVIDRDEGESRTGQHKQRLSAELSTLDPPRHVWMTEHRCIEFYIKAHSADASLQKVFTNCRSLDRNRKVQYARKYVVCTESKPLEEIVDLDTDIRHQLRTIHDDIRRWAGQDQNQIAGHADPASQSPPS
jgi:hypothetical protein